MKGTTLREWRRQGERSPKWDVSKPAATGSDRSWIQWGKVCTVPLLGVFSDVSIVDGLKDGHWGWPWGYFYCSYLGKWCRSLINVGSPLAFSNSSPIKSKHLKNLEHWHSSQRQLRGEANSCWLVLRGEDDSRMSNRIGQGTPFLTPKSNKGLQTLAFLISLFSDIFG